MIERERNNYSTNENEINLMMLKSIVVLIAVTLVLSCNQHDRESKTNNATSTLKTDQVGLNREDFDRFFKKFDSDTVFQLTRIKFPLKVISLDETGEKIVESYISRKKVNNVGVNKLKEPKMISKKKQISPDEIEIQFRINDTGYEKDYLFERTSGKWFLISVKDLSD